MVRQSSHLQNPGVLQKTLSKQHLQNRFKMLKMISAFLAVGKKATSISLSFFLFFLSLWNYLLSTFKKFYITVD